MENQEKKPSTAKKGCFGCLGIIVLFLVVGVIFGGSDNNDSANKASSPATKQSSAPVTPKVKTYPSGQYKVGTDLPAGEYVALSKNEAYIEVARNVSGTLDSILANDIFINRSIITVSNGQFLKVQGATLYAFADAPKVQTKDGFLPSGMYKVGVDLPAGEYKVISEGGDSYIESSSSSRHILDDIIANDLFQGDKYIQVANGQYLKFFRAKIKVQ